MASLEDVPLATAYHRPATLKEALRLLAEPNRVLLAGGTVLNADRERAGIEMVDLQSLGLDEISEGPGFLRIGATATLDALARHELTPDWLKEIARAEAPSTLRTLATIGGLVASGWGDSVLIAALLASDGLVKLAGAPSPTLEEVLEDGVPDGAVITSVTIGNGGSCATATVGRTPADVPIVAAVARTWTPPSGIPITQLALSGVAEIPVLVDPEDPTTLIDSLGEFLAAIGSSDDDTPPPRARLSPPGDFRGSASYRLELAKILGARALGRLA